MTDTPSTSLLQQTMTVSSVTVLSRITGLGRDVAIAIFVGAGQSADVFFVAFRLPQFLRRLFAEGAFAMAFVPVLSEYRQKHSNEVHALINRVFAILTSALLAVSAVAMVASPVIIAVFATGFLLDDAKFNLASSALRITFPYLLFISLVGFAGAIFNSYQRFLVPAMTPIILNLSLIGGAFFAVPLFDEPALAMAWVVLFAGCAQLLLQIPFLHRMRLIPHPIIDIQHPGVRRIFTLMLPALFGVSVGQINLLIDTIIASFLPVGSISWLYFSDKVMELPLGIFAVAIATVMLPVLSLTNAQGNSKQYQRTINWGLTLALTIGLPAAVALIILAHPIAITLFQYRELSAADAHRIGMGVIAYTAGLIAFITIKVLAPGYYARQDMKTPVRYGVVAMIANTLLNFILVYPLHYWWDKGYIGLAIATSLAAFINSGLLLYGLIRRGHLSLERNLAIAMVRALAATAIMAGALFLISFADWNWIGWTWSERTLHLAGLCLGGGIVYTAVLFCCGARLRHFVSPR